MTASDLLLALAALCLVLWFTLRFVVPRRPTGLPPGDVVYAGNARQVRLLTAPEHGLSGRPDYVIKQGEDLIPVELKSGAAPKKSYDSDRMQVIAQALLVEAEFGTRPAFGLVQYPGKTFRVSVRPQSVTRLLDAVRLMREARATGLMPDVPPSWFYCPTCTRTTCPKRAKQSYDAHRAH